ncbi:MAG: type II toxin-antitoxin system HicA family toxin [Armatimonadetes bacterium]|nr:type II toxin-antitoxin system HicA family toxin [Armatimonadota bacterium]
MPKLPRFTSKEAESMLIKAGFKLIRTKGSHKIYFKKNKRMIIPFHGNKVLHLKITKQIIKTLSEIDL